MTAESHIAKLIASGVELPPLPSIGAELLTVGRQPISSIDVAALARLIETDPGLSARIVRIANSPFFGVVGEVTNIRHAIMLIGLAETIDTLYFYVVTKTVPRFPTIEGFSYEEYWAHSRACAVAAKMLGRPQFSIKALPGELYLAGLFHGIGKVIMALKMRESFEKSLALAAREKIPLHLAEDQVFGYTHMQLGAEMLRAWNIPESILAAVRHYATPELAPPRHQEMAGVTQVAFCMANLSGMGFCGGHHEIDLSGAWLLHQKNSPLQDEETQKQLVEDILETLDQRTKIIFASSMKNTRYSYLAQSRRNRGRAGRKPAEGPASSGARPGLWRRIVKTIADFLGS